jgi:TRAP-type C4-dicarboxylate transport system permease small subunit
MWWSIDLELKEALFMKSNGAIRPISMSVDSIIKVLVLMGCIIYGILALVVVFNVACRFLIRQPIKGTVEVVEIAMLFVAFFAVPFAAKKRAHITVRLFVHRFPELIQTIVYRIGFLLSAVIAGVITYQAIVNTIYSIRHLYETTPVMFIPFAPLKFVMAFGCLILFLVLLLDTLYPIQTQEEPKGGEK